MSKQSWQTSRRMVLKGVGVSMALPLLDAMAPAIARAQNTPAAGASAAPVPPGAAPIRVACL